MMRIGHDIRWHRLLSVLIAATPFVVLLVLAGAVYLLKWSALSDTAEGRRLEIQKIGWIAANAKRLGTELAATDHSMETENVLGVGDSDSAAAELQSSVKGLLDSATMQISSIQPLGVNEENGIRFISVRAQASGSYSKILEFLQAAHSATPAVLIGALDLMPDPTQPSAAGDASGVRYLLQFEAVRLMAAGQ